LPLNDPTVFVTLTSVQERAVVACNPKAVFQRRLISPLPQGLAPGEAPPSLPEADMSFILARAESRKDSAETPLFSHAQIERENIYEADEYWVGEEQTKASMIDSSGKMVAVEARRLDREEKLAVKGVYFPVKPPSEASLFVANVQNSYDSQSRASLSTSSMVGYIPNFTDQVALPDGFQLNLPSLPGQKVVSAPSESVVVAPTLLNFDPSVSEKKKKLLQIMEIREITVERIRDSNLRSKKSYTVDQLMEIAGWMEIGPMKGNKQALITGILSYLNKYGIN